MKELPVIQPVEESTASQAGSDKRTMIVSILDYLRTSFFQGVEIVRSIYIWVALGVLVSAAISTFTPASTGDYFKDQSTWIQAIGALLISAPLYVCATASVPIASALVGQGLSAGATLVFLMAGPATNVATIGAVAKSFSRFALVSYVCTIVLGSVLAAVLFDYLFDLEPISIQDGHHQHSGVLSLLSAIALSASFIGFFAKDALDGRLRSRIGFG